MKKFALIVIFILFLGIAGCQKQQVKEKNNIEEKVKIKEEKTTNSIDNEFFALEYPKTWEQKENEGLIILLPTKNEEELTIIIKHEIMEEDIKLEDLKEFFESTDSTLSDVSNLESKEIEIDKKKAYQTYVEYKFENENGEKQDHVIDSRYALVNKNFFIVEIGGNKKAYSDNKEDIEKAISTIKIK